MSRDCWSKKNSIESNVAKYKKEMEEEWLNYMTDNQSDAMEVRWPSENVLLSNLDNIEEILQQKTREQIVHIC